MIWYSADSEAGPAHSAAPVHDPQKSWKCLRDLFGKDKGDISSDDFIDAVCGEECSKDALHDAETLFSVLLEAHGNDGRVNVKKLPHVLRREEDAQRLAGQFEMLDDLMSAIKR